MIDETTKAASPPTISARGKLRIVVVIAALVVVLIVLLPFHLMALGGAKVWALFRGKSVGGLVTGAMPFLFHKAVLRCMGVRLKLHGQISNARPLLLVANHVSWLDIVVLGAVAPLSFVAKSEMRSWPVFGQLAMLQRTVFVARDDRRRAGIQATEIAARMTAREIMVLFPEGTTSDGMGLLPFKTPLFEAAKLALAESPVTEAAVQPVALRYSHLSGLPMGRAQMPHVAWPGEIGLGESLLPIIAKGAIDVAVHLGHPIAMDECANRKVVAAQAGAAIRQMLLPRHEQPLR
ncbi:MAG: lysophospholipid acyltransferase family protein [Pseudomonadota bacterium]